MPMLSQIAKPGLFSVDSTAALPPKLDLNVVVGAKSHIFRPPRTPTVSSSLCASSTAPLASDCGSDVLCRKRSRRGSLISHRVGSSSVCDASQLGLDSPGTSSPVSLVNTQYFLAGGLDTPTASFESGIARNSEFAAANDLDLHDRRGWAQSSSVHSEGYFPPFPPALRREANGRARLQRAQSPRRAWEKAIYNVVGAAGKLWNFCRVTAFQGFYAGGGQGFRLYAPAELVRGERNMGRDLNEQGEGSLMEVETSFVPGRFPEEDFIPDYMSRDHTSPHRPAKKIQREKGGGDLQASWIMVGNVETSRESSPVRLSARKVPSAASPSRRPASRAGRRPGLHTSRSSQSSFAGSPAIRSGRPASYASTRSPVTTPKYESPIGAEVQRHAARMRKREMEDDAHLKRFNQQLKAMIKEGKEALGARFEVEDEMDEGYSEGDPFERGKG